MIDWIQRDDDEVVEGDDQKYSLDQPYSLKSNDEFERKVRNRAMKQKYMRELRVIECVVDLLYMPYASGAFDFIQIT